MATLWQQTTNNDSYSMGSKAYWGGDFSDSTFHNQTITTVQFTIDGSAATKTIDLYRFDPTGSSSNKTLLQSKSFTLTSGTNTLTFDNLSNNTLGSSGNYIAIEDNGNLSGYTFREASSSPSGTNPTLVETMIMTGTSWSQKSNEYPTGFMGTGSTPPPGPGPSGDTVLLPPPIAVHRL